MLYKIARSAALAVVAMFIGLSPAQASVSWTSPMTCVLPGVLDPKLSLRITSGSGATVDRVKVSYSTIFGVAARIESVHVALSRISNGRAIGSAYGTGAAIGDASGTLSLNLPTVTRGTYADAAITYTGTPPVGGRVTCRTTQTVRLG